MTETAPSDDRAPAEISFAATNLVKPDLTSARRKSDTPLTKEAPAASGGARAERQVFPPTPPPENEFSQSKPMRSNTVTGGPSNSRSLSVRGGPPRARSRDGIREDRDRDRTDDSDRYQSRRPRGPEPRRAYSTRAPAPAPAQIAQRSRTVRERGDRGAERRRPNDRISEYSDEVEDNPYSEEIYDSYADGREPPRRGTGSIRRGLTRRGTTRQERFMDDDEYASDAYEGSSFDEDEFEMLDARSVRSGASRRAPEVKKV